MRACRICRDTPRFLPALPHEPRPIFVLSPNAKVLIASQAPGTRAHLSGRPFTDASGHRLRDWMGVSTDEFYNPDLFAILPMGFCFPGQDKNGGDLPPRRECAPQWRVEALATLSQLELVLLIGQYSQGWHRPDDRRPLTKQVKDWRSIFAWSETPKLLPLPHPSWRNTGWLKRNPWFETELVPVLRAEIRQRISV
jgi:uracil-DNA glycosylase